MIKKKSNCFLSCLLNTFVLRLSQVGARTGSVLTFSGSDLTKRSTVPVCDPFQVTTLLISPDKKWLTAGTKDNDDFNAKVFFIIL